MHGRKARRAAGGGWRLAAYGSSSGLVEESAQDGDLEERVERHVVICARAGGQCGATRRDGGGSGSGCSSSCCVPAPRVEGVLGVSSKRSPSVGKFSFPVSRTAAILQRVQTLIGPRGRKPGRPAQRPAGARTRSFRGAPQAALVAWRPSGTTRWPSASGRSPRGTSSAPPRLRLPRRRRRVGLRAGCRRSLHTLLGPAWARRSLSVLRSARCSQ